MAHRLVVGVFLCLLSLTSTLSWGQTVAFVDAQGAPASVLLDHDTARVRVVDPGGDTGPGRDSVAVTVSSDLAADAEPVTLLETGPGTGVFEGVVNLYPLGDPDPPGDPALATATTSGGTPSRDTVRASYPSTGATASAGLVGSVLQFIDSWGLESATFAAGDLVRLRVRDEMRNDHLSRDSFLVTITSQGAGDSETMLVEETGKNTGVFEGTLFTVRGGAATPSDGVLRVASPDTVTASLVALDGVTTASAQVERANGLVRLLGADGEPVDSYLEGENVRVAVIDPFTSANTVSVQVTAARTGDSETLILNRVLGALYEGEIPTRMIYFSSPTPGDGLLQITETYTPALDAVTATHGSGASASAGFLTGRIAFVDGRGEATSSYATGTEVHVRLEAPSRNTPARDQLSVQLTNVTWGINQTLDLVETSRDSGVFVGSMPLSGSGQEPPTLSVDPGNQIRVHYDHVVPELGVEAFAVISTRALWFLDERGEPTNEIVESGPARVRMYSPDDNVNAGSADSATVEMRVLLSEDLEPLTLTETGPDTDVFEGTIPLEMSSLGQPDGTLQTANTGPPDYRQDEVMARSGPVEATARTIGARIRFLDAFGRETTSYAVGEPVRLRIIDPFWTLYGNSFQVTLAEIGGHGDVETVTLQETGPTTGIFEATVPTSPTGPAAADGTLSLVGAEQIEVRHVTSFSPLEITARAEVRMSSVQFVDAAGQPAEVYLESTRAYLRVISATDNSSPSVADTVMVQLIAELSQDIELVTLTETGPATGVFQGSIQLRLSSTPYGSNGILETTQAGGSSTAHEFDTLRATFQGALGEPAVARIGLTGSRTWFTDAGGAEVLAYPIGGRAYLRVEDHNANSTPTVINYVIVQVRSTTTGDLESLNLLETGQNTGIFTGSLPLPPGWAAADSALQVQPGDLIEAWHEDSNGVTASSAAAGILDASVEIIDEQGEPTETLLQGDEVRVRVFSHSGNSNPAQAESVTVQLQSFYGSDTETLTLTETAPNTSVFEGVLPLETGFSPNGGLMTSYGPYPEYPEDRVTASYGSASDQARVFGARIVLLDAFGRKTETYAAGETVRVRVEDHARNSGSTTRDSAYVDVRSSTGDRESLQLQETGYDTSIFEGTLPTVLSGGALYNGQLLVAGGGTVVAEIYPYGAGSSVTTQASITGNSLRFVDAAGQPATDYLEGSRAFLRVISAADNTSNASVQTVTVELSSDLVEDTELLTLTETGPATAVFEGSIPLRLMNAAFLNDGALQTYEESGPPHRFDTIRATFQDPQGTSVAQIGLTGSRTWFVDAAGNETLSYPAGGTVRVRVEAPSRNNSWQYDFTNARVRSLVNNDVEVIQLQETARDSGIFTGSLPTALEYDAVAIDGLLRVQPGEQIEAEHEDVLGFTASSAIADIEDRSIEILDDETGLSGVLLEKGRARVRVFSVFDNANPGQAESVTVQVSSQFGADVETLALTETGPDTGLFEGTLPLDSDFNGNLTGSLRTSYGPYPEKLEDRVTASYGQVSAQARVAGASIVFLDSYGRETATYAAGESVRVRVIDHNRNSSNTSFDTAYIALSSSTGDDESFEVRETGYNTAVFEGTIPTVLTGGVSSNGQLLVTPGGTIEAGIYPYAANSPVTTQAAITGNVVRFVDAAGQPASSYLESSRAYLQVTSVTRNTSSSTVETVSVQMNTELGSDSELVTLTETGANTGVFRGSIALRLAASTTPGDGVLQTHQVGGPPHEYDTLRATYTDASGTSVARIGQTGSRVWFVDATGAEVSSYPIGGTVRVRVEDQNLNTPNQWDFLPVRVRSLTTQDEEVVQLQETSRNSGVFAGSLPLAATGPQGAGDGRLLAQAGERIEAIHDEVILESKATAVIENLAIQFVDAEGEPTGTLIEKGTARVRVFSVLDSSSLSVELRSVYGSDVETLTLTETGAGTHVFEGTLPLDTDFNTNQSGSLRTSYGPYPEKLEDRVTASFGPISTEARVVGSSIVFLDRYGRETATYAAGETVRVRVIDYNRNYNSTSFDTTYIALSSSTGDDESFQIEETGYNTSVFEGTMPTVLTGGVSSNGQLLVAPGGTIEAGIYPYAANGPVTTQAAITGNAVRFVDAAGQPASSYLESSRAYLEVTSATRNTSSTTAQTVTVQLNTELGADSELVTLTETGANTGVFRGSIALRLVSSSASPGDGVLQTYQISGPPHEYDTLRATYNDPSGTSLARIGLTGSRVWFVDATGAEVTSYPVGGTVRVRVEDQNRNTPGQWDFVPARVRSLTTQDEEIVQLQETSRDSGVFAGSLPLAAAGPQGAGDGRLLAQAGERIEALYDEVILQSRATAAIENLAIQFVDAAGEPTGMLIEKGTARVRVFSVLNSSSLSVELRSVYGSDVETLTLTETGAGTHVFEGTLPLDTDFNTNQSGSLRTSYGPYPEKLEDRVTASFGPISTEARVVGSSIVFLDRYGRETATYAAGETVRVRVIDYNRNYNSTSFDTTYIALSSSTGDDESFEIRETGYNTSVFEGTMPTVLTGGVSSNGQLLVAPGGTIETGIYPYAANGPVTVQAAITGNAVRFVDAAGQSVSSYLESSRAYLEVTSATRNTSSTTVQTVTVQLNTELGADSELVTLTETGANTGLFRGSIALRRVSSAANSGDGVLQTYQISGPPHEYDTLRATYNDPSGTSVAHIGLTGSRVWFVDATGAEVASYPVGGTVRVRVEDQNRNTPGQWDFVPARVRSLTTQDEEIVQLQETSRDSGVFAGSLPLAATGPQGLGDGRLLAQAGEPIEAVYDEVLLQSKATATIEDLAIWFIDAAGEPTETLIEKGTARVRAFSVFASSSLTVELRSIYGSDVETLTLTETGAGTHVFEGTLPLDTDFNTNQPGSLRTSYGPYPEKLEDRVTASFGPVSAEARVVGSGIVFLDAYGRETTTYAAGETVRVRVTDHNRNTNTASIDSAYVDLSSSAGDVESFELQETGENTSVFEGTMPTALSGGVGSNSQLLVAPGGTIQAGIYPYAANGPVTTQAAITGNAVRFVDASGQPASSYLESSRAYLQVTSATRNTSSSTVETVSVQLNNELGADSELVTLTETGVNTGIFRGSIALRLVFSAANPGDGVLQTHQVSGPPHEFDTLRATYSDPSGTSVARIGLTGSRTWFTDAQGTEALSFPANARVYVRVEDHNFDTPGVIDQIPAMVRSLTTQDEEPVQLTETGTDTGVFVGSLRLSGPPASLGDGRLLVQVGEQIEAEHEDAGGFTTSSAVADVTTQVNQAPEPTADTVTTPEDEAVTVSVLANDGDADQDPLDVISITQPAIGTAVLNANDSITYTPPANTSGEAVFSYTVRDPAGLEATASVTVSITPVNDLPTCQPDTATVPEDGSVIIDVLANDTDPENDTLYVRGFSIPPGQGTAVINPDGTVTYSPKANFNGQVVFTYYADDAHGSLRSAQVTVTVTPTGDAPVANPDTASVVEDFPKVIAVLSNDIDVDNDALSVTAVTNGAHGTVGINPDKTVTYTPATNYNGTDTFTYTVSDATGATAIGTVTVTILATNDDPIANPDTATVAEDGTVTIDVLANDTDPDNNPFEILLVYQGTRGTVTLNPDKTVTYKPNANFSGTDTFDYSIVDSTFRSDLTTVTVTVTPVNDAPVANADAATVAEDGSVSITVLSNDTDVENNTLSLTAVTQGTNGAVVINPNKTVTYTPSANFSGVDTFTYTVSDGNGGTATATVTVTVTPVNDAPVANADAATVAEDGSVSISVLGNDTDAENNTLTVTAVTQGANGSVVIHPDKTVTYTPAANFSGADTFTYTISDGNGGTATATVTVTTTSTNDSPVAVADSATVAEDGTVTVTVLGNDTDPENNTLDVISVSQGSHGTVSINPNETVTYTPAANYNGADSFTYTVSDGNGGTATATVTVTITSVNDAPLALADGASVAEDGAVNIAVLGNDSDPENDTLDVTAFTQGARGTVTLNADDTVTYAPNANFAGTDTFTYTVSDGNGGTATATVTVSVVGDNDAPTASPDSATVAEDGSVSIPVLANDSDPDDDALDVTAVTQGAHGTVTIEPDKTLTYEPAANYHGTDSFTYTISDGNGGTALAVVSLTVTPVNDDPVAADDQASGSEDGTVAIAVLGNDSDADDDSLTIASVTQGSNGSVTVQADQTLIYAPNANFNGTDSFTYTIEDGNGGTATATVTVSIGSENDSPVAVADSASGSEDGSVIVTVLGNDTDPENDTLDVLSITLGANGSAVINADETVTYTPDANFHGTDSFTYTIGDGNGGTATATVTVTITSVNDTPVANDDAASVAEDGSVSVAVLTNDDDADSDPLTIASVTQGANGSVAIDGQTVIYTPNANFNGTDSFTYTVADGNGGTATASVAITVTSGNDGPVATPDTASVSEDGAVTVTVLANDSDPENDTLQVTSVTQGADGTVAINGGATVTYTPDANFHGTDSFTYTIEDGNGGTATTTVTVTVTSVNDVPVANADAGSVPEDGSVSLAVLTNDDDADGDTLSITGVTQGANGSATVNPNKTITYTPSPNFQGSDVFTYTVSDGNGGTATASVSVTVTGVNDAPVANPNSATTPEDTSVNIAILANDTDADGDTLQVASVTQGTKGSVAIQPDRTVTYTPNANVSGSDSFTYTVSDGNGGTATATVTLTITAVNDAPVAVNDTATTTAEVLVNVAVLGNDVDVDSPSLSVTSVTQPAHGTTVINADKTIRYTPEAGYKGSDAFTYTISDGAGGTATATVSVTVNAPPRVTGNLQVLYNFNEGSGSTVTDTSGTGTPLNLTVANPGAVSWLSGGLSVNSATLIQSAGAATKVISACQTSNAITIEAWVAPDNISQTGPAPIVSISQASNKRNVTFGQSANRWDGRLRTSTTNQAGNTVQTAAGTVSTTLSHVVYTRDSAGNIRIYVNGVQSTTSTLTGNFSAWTTSYKLGLVNELATGSPWLGDLYLVAIYSRALSATEVRQNWLAGE